MGAFYTEDGLLSQLQCHFKDENEQGLRIAFRDAFNSSENNVFFIALSAATKARFMFKPNMKSITEIALEELETWLKTKKDLAPSRKDRDDAMLFLVSYGIQHMKKLAEIYHLDRGPGREFLAEHLKFTIETKGDLKEAATIVTSLNLQEYIKPTELYLPLFVADKFQVLEMCLENNSNAQKKYAEMLNSLCGMGEGRVIEYIQGELYLKITNRTKLQPKTLQKVSEKVIKKYNLDPAHYPNIFREKNMKSLKHLLFQKYRSPEHESAKYNSLIEAAVSNNAWMQEQLIMLLLYERRDINSAVYFVRKCNIPSASLPQRLQDELKRTPHSSFETMQPKASFHRVNKVPSRFWEYPLDKDSVEFVNTCQALEKCLKVVFKHGNIIGFDGEWQPKYGRAGEHDKMAIMQLAVKDKVFIIDILQFEKTVEGQRLLEKLFKLLFTSEDTVRLGYGIDSDVSVITNTYKYANEFHKKAKNFDDLAYISKQIMSNANVIEKLKLDCKSYQTDRGLSQLVKQCLGKPLDKTYQVSNWEQRPLSGDQLKYAALDALCLIKIYDIFEDLAAEFHINVEMNEKDWIESNVIQEESEQKVLPLSIPSNPVNEATKRPGDLAVVCDTMLQGLGKSLRSLGVDAKILSNANCHKEAIRLCKEEKRIVLTKGKPFFQFVSKLPDGMCMCVPDGKTESQVQSIFKHYNIRATLEDVFSRCQICNSADFVEIEPNKMMIAFMRKKHVKPKQLSLSSFQVSEIIQTNNDPQIDYRSVTINKGVNLQCEFIPLPVFENVRLFYCCAFCGKVYWIGSHYEKIREQFSRVIDDTTYEQ
eukprot:gene5049-5707_t